MDPWTVCMTKHAHLVLATHLCLDVSNSPFSFRVQTQCLESERACILQLLRKKKRQCRQVFTNPSILLPEVTQSNFSTQPGLPVPLVGTAAFSSNVLSASCKKPRLQKLHASLSLDCSMDQRVPLHTCARLQGSGQNLYPDLHDFFVFDRTINNENVCTSCQIGPTPL